VLFSSLLSISLAVIFWPLSLNSNPFISDACFVSAATRLDTSSGFVIGPSAAFKQQLFQLPHGNLAEFFLVRQQLARFLDDRSIAIERGVRFSGRLDRGIVLGVRQSSQSTALRCSLDKEPDTRHSRARENDRALLDGRSCEHRETKED
jgi:hypothetical protein